MIHRLISRIEITDDELLIALKPSAFGISHNTKEKMFPIPLPSQKPFGEHKLRLSPEHTGQTEPNPDLVKLLQEAMAVQKLVLTNHQTPLNQLAQMRGCCRKRMTKLLQLSWLSPDAVEAILAGRHSSSLSRARLLSTSLPLAWQDQEELLALR